MSSHTASSSPVLRSEPRQGPSLCPPWTRLSPAQLVDLGSSRGTREPTASSLSTMDTSLRALALPGETAAPVTDCLRRNTGAARELAVAETGQPRLAYNAAHPGLDLRERALQVSTSPLRTDSSHLALQPFQLLFVGFD